MCLHVDVAAFLRVCAYACAHSGARVYVYKVVYAYMHARLYLYMLACACVDVYVTECEYEYREYLRLLSFETCRT